LILSTLDIKPFSSDKPHITSHHITPHQIQDEKWFEEVLRVYRRGRREGGEKEKGGSRRWHWGRRKPWRAGAKEGRGREKEDRCEDGKGGGGGRGGGERGEKVCESRKRMKEERRRLEIEDGDALRDGSSTS